MDATAFRTFFAYNRWANDRILTAARAVSPADYHAPAPGLSFSTLHGTLVHAFVAENVWLGRWTGSPVTGLLGDARRTDRIVETEITTREDLLARRSTVTAGFDAFAATLTPATDPAPLH